MKKISALLLFSLYSSCYAWNMGDVFSGMSVNITSPGSYQDQAAGYYSGGGFSIRTKKSNFQPVGLTPPSIKMGCSGIDLFAGSFSLFKGDQLVNMAKNLGAQAKSYGYQLALKTFAPQIEQLLSKLRELAMQLNEFSVEECQLTQALFASALPKDSALYETVCKDLQRQHGGTDYFKSRDACEKHEHAKQKAAELEKSDSQILLVNYNLFMKAAIQAGIPRDLAISMMSLTGTLIMEKGRATLYGSLVKDNDTWTAHLKGGDAASYQCEDPDCLKIKLIAKQNITPENSYQGKAAKRLEKLRTKLQTNENFNQEDIGFLSAIGETFPIYDYISFEAISGEHLIDKSSDLVATYLVLQYVQKVTEEVKQALYVLGSKQMNDQHIKEYLLNLNQLQSYVSSKYQDLMYIAHNLEKRAKYLEAHQLAKMRG